MKKLLLLLSLFTAAAPAALALNLYVPGTANSGESYDVSADSSWPASIEIYLYKNGGLFAYSGIGDYYASTGGSSVDTGNQTVNYSAYAQYEYYGGGSDYEYASANVAIVVPNRAPTITWVQNPTWAAINEWFTIQARGNDPDGNLTNVLVWRESSPHAFNGGGNGYESYSDPNGSSLDHEGTVTFAAQAFDSSGASSEVIYHTVYIYQPNRSPDGVTISSGGVIDISLGQSIHITGTMHDPDGNLACHELLVAAPYADWTMLNPGPPSNPTNSSIASDFTPNTPGPWQFLTRGHDGQYWGPWATLTVNVVDRTNPTPPGTLTATNVTGTTFTLNWGAASDNVGVAFYRVWRGSEYLGQFSATALFVSGLTQSTTYSMTVRAGDAAGNLSAARSLDVTTADTEPPSTPTGLASSNATATSFTLSWVASTDNRPGTVTYEVYKAGLPLTTTSGTSVTVNALSQGTSYSMTVRARDIAGNLSAFSPALSVTTSDTQPPTTPAGLTASAVGPYSFTLSWTPSTDNASASNQIVYEVRRDTTLLISPPQPGTAFSVTGLSPSTGYSLTVRARDMAGNWSAWSVPRLVSTPSLDQTTDTDQDGVPDLIEQRLGTDPNSTQANDPDATNRTNLNFHRPNP